MNITLNGKTCFTLGSTNVLISEHPESGLHIKINSQIYAFKNLEDSQLKSERFTALHLKDAQLKKYTVSMLEHLLAGLFLFVRGSKGILIEVKKDGAELFDDKSLEVEVPMFDGSALVVYDEVKKNFEKLSGFQNWQSFEVPEDDKTLKSLAVQNKHGQIKVEKAQGFEIEYTWKSKGLKQKYHLKSMDQYIHEIIPARTFIHQEDYNAIVKNGGLCGAEEGQGIIWSVSEASGSLKPQIILHSGGPLRFKNEFVRHKVLDLMGDLMLLGGSLPKVKLMVTNSGHALNQELVKKLRKYVIS
jgi:UDP-3-O-acyl-N-acetylglucosamine deacetylase